LKAAIVGVGTPWHRQSGLETRTKHRVFVAEVRTFRNATAAVALVPTQSSRLTLIRRGPRKRTKANKTSKKSGSLVATQYVV
jgi:hypothetical protein